ncbi:MULTISPECIES: TadE family protein [unclassified Streptomyces]|uniref:TadE family protein n=1 Tax=unclassified Streptomyces TaxID=2593676 RepID=UPI00225AEC23|nr:MULTISPECIES: TadE family protein [unclassified Streptomyces]MCX4532985.1 pilus assembly protein [Streptomyces sp. NBC_01669]WSA01566.1 pilus assembly protein [Streptomyces sp. NBC_00841]
MATTEMNGPEIRETQGVRGRRYRTADREHDGCRVTGRDRDRGQTAIEFLGVTPLIILLMIALWQCALIGYTFSLAGNSADEAAHKGAISGGLRAQACRQVATEHLPKAWREKSRTTCRSSSDMYKAEVKLKVPVLVPGVLNWPFHVTGNAAAPLEG